MKTFDEFKEQEITEAKEFKSTLEATEFIGKIESSIKDARMMDWAKATSSKTVKELKNLESAFDKFWKALNEEG